MQSQPSSWYKKFLKKPTTRLSLVFLLIITLLAVFAPYVTLYSYDQQNITERLQGPSLQHWMGTDALGRDLYSRILYGARMSLAVGVFSAFFSLILGTWVGSIAGYFGGWIDTILMRMVDMLYIFPSPLLAILLMLLLGRGFTGILIALSITSWVTQARLVRGQVLQVRELTYVEAARALGLSHFGIISRHILPNILGPIIVSLTIQIPNNIMAESFLSFIGLGLQPPHSSWGTLANEGFRAIQSYPHLILFPGVILFLSMLAFSTIGDELNHLALKQLSPD
jgi:oligopeptide transport system permease protein